MQLAAINILGTLPESEAGNTYIFMAVDNFTRWVEAYPMLHQVTTVDRKFTGELFICFSPTETASFWSGQAIWV